MIKAHLSFTPLDNETIEVIFLWSNGGLNMWITKNTDRVFLTDCNEYTTFSSDTFNEKVLIKTYK